MHDSGLGSWPRRRARMAPDRPALIDGDRTITYAEVERQATQLARGLHEAGVARSDRVAFLGPNSTEFVITMFAAAKLGAVFVPMNTRLAPPEAAYLLRDCTPAAFVWADACADLAHAPDVAALGLRRFAADEQGPGSLRGLCQGRGEDPLDEPVSLDDLFMVQYTSGTSGRPKGALLTHGNVTWNVLNLLIDVDLTSDETALVSAPLFHVAALNQVLLPTFLKGACSILEPRWDAARALTLIERHHVTLLFGVTTMYQSLAAEPRWRTADLSSLRSAISGGAPLPESLLRAYLDRGLMIQQGYGLTESSPGASFLRGDDNLRKVGSAGTSCFFSDLRVVDPGLRDADPGEIGEILVHGPNVTAGYWQRPDATAEAFAGDGWLRTGDLGRRDDEGHLYIVDRLKDMIISGGENIYPAEVERAVYTHPAVAECAVIGIPDQRWGEVGRVVVVLRPGRSMTAEELLEHLDGRLARYKIPKSVVIAEELPHTGSGKLVKARVRELFGSPSLEPVEAVDALDAGGGPR